MGLRNTYDLLLDVLIKEGLEPIETWDQPFDPPVHEAVVTTGDGQGDHSRSLRSFGADTSCVARGSGPPWWPLPLTRPGPNQAITETDSGPIQNQAI